jgi:hypothetical protein
VIEGGRRIEARSENVGNKISHLGMSGHLAVMSELLRLGYNVSMPYVDVGEDIYVIDDVSGEHIAHVQVKTATADADPARQSVAGGYQLRRDQLFGSRRTPLFYAFALLTPNEEWDFIIIKREELNSLRREYDKKRGALKELSSPTYFIQLQFTEKDVRVWDSSLQTYRGRMVLERYFPRVTSGPGAR